MAKHKLTLIEWFKFLKRQELLDSFNSKEIVELRKLHNLVYKGTIPQKRESLLIEI